jgi:hypothetical protein
MIEFRSSERDRQIRPRDLRKLDRAGNPTRRSTFPIPLECISRRPKPGSRHEITTAEQLERTGIRVRGLCWKGVAVKANENETESMPQRHNKSTSDNDKLNKVLQHTS